MMLKPLVEVFKNDKSAEGKKQYARYSKKIKENADFFIKYAKAAVKSINTAHETSPCMETFECSGLNKIIEGGVWFVSGKHTASTRRCTCTINDGNKDLCIVDVTIRVDGKQSYKTRMLRCPDEDFNCASKALPKKLMGYDVWQYVRDDTNIVKPFWKTEIEDMIPVWSLAYDVPKNARRDEALDVLSDEPDVVFDEEADERSGEEERREARLAKAEKELSMSPPM